MKYLQLTLILLGFSCTINADQLSSYEEHYIKMNHLKSELEQLEMERKIQSVEIELIKNKEIINNGTQINLNASNPNNVVTQVPGRISESPGFDPSTLNIKYVLGSGSKRRIIFFVEGKRYSLTTGQIYRGWKLIIEDKKIQFSKGKEKVEI